jgi:hypothetical protein
MFLSAKGLQQHELFEAKPSFKQFLIAFESAMAVGVFVLDELRLWLSCLGRSLRQLSGFDLGFSFRRIEQHGSTHTVLAILTHENFIVDTALASLPKLFIGCKL